MNGEQLEDFEFARAARCHNLDRIAGLLVEERTSNRRRRRDQSLGRIGIFRHDELKDHLLATVLLDVERRTESGAIVRNAVDIDQSDFRHALLQHADARFDESLALLRRVIFRVFSQVAQLARAFDLLRELELQLAIEGLNLVFELPD